MYPKSFEKLVESFMRLPGVGKKSAERYAYHVLNSFTDEDTQNFIVSLDSVSHNIHKCPICGFFTDEDKCEYCKDNDRDQSVILVVEQPKDVESIERCMKYNGLYHVLNGSLSPLNGIGPDELNLNSLFDRCKNDNVKEVIIATSATVQGEATAQYINRILERYNKNVSRIAYGMPVGSSLEYNDETTILKALEGRRKMN